MSRRALASQLARDDSSTLPITSVYEWPGCHIAPTPAQSWNPKNKSSSRNSNLFQQVSALGGAHRLDRTENHRRELREIMQVRDGKLISRSQEAIRRSMDRLLRSPTDWAEACQRRNHLR
jgi:hypothetical protein